jgi:hypothetical protein
LATPTHGQPKYWHSFSQPTPYQFFGVKLNWGLKEVWAHQIIGFNPNNTSALGQRQLFGLSVWGSHPNRPSDPIPNTE